MGVLPRGLTAAVCCLVVAGTVPMVEASPAQAALTLFGGPAYPYGSASDTSPLALAPLRQGGPGDFVAVDDLNPGSIMVLLGNGDGTVESPVDYAVTGTVEKILIADLNNDGNPDVVVVDQQGFSVLLGNGDGTLQSAVHYTPLSTGQTMGGFTLGDFNGDGYPDVAFGACASGFPPPGDLVVWLNKKDGTFEPGSTSTTSSGACAQQVIAGTFHGTSHPDDVVGLEAGQLAMHTGNGDGTLQTAQPISGLGAEQGQLDALLAVGDFNGDGNLDFVWAGQGAASRGLVMMFPGQGDGSFATPVDTTLLPAAAGSLAVADFDQDGIDDLAVSASQFGLSWTGAEVLLGSPSGEFAAGSTDPLVAASFLGAQVAAGDIDGDGYPDLAVTQEGSILPYLNGSLVSFDTAGVDFGLVPRGGSADQTVTVSNAGDPPMDVFSVSIVSDPTAGPNTPQDFTIVRDGCAGVTLDSGASCLVQVRLAPSAAGERDAALEVDSDSPVSPDLQSLTGTGVSPPANTTAPSISGSPAVARALSCAPGAWSSGAPISYAYQWLRDGTAIGGATSPSYTVAPADTGHALACEVTATNLAGSTSVTSSAASVAPPIASLPAIGSETLAPTTFAAAPSGPSAHAAKRRYGTKATYTLNEAATVRFTVFQLRPGRSTRGGRCVKPTRRNRTGRACTQILPVPGSFTLVGNAGTNTFRFSGRISGRALKPGTYKLVATPYANGNTGQTKSTLFRIVK